MAEVKKLQAAEPKAGVGGGGPLPNMGQPPRPAPQETYVNNAQQMLVTYNTECSHFLFVCGLFDITFSSTSDCVASRSFLLVSQFSYISILYIRNQIK
jgi:hypothetical protein